MDPNVLESLFDYFGNKPFMRFQAQGFDQYVFENAYRKEEDEFVKIVEMFPRD